MTPFYVLLMVVFAALLLVSGLLFNEFRQKRKAHEDLDKVKEEKRSIFSQKKSISLELTRLKEENVKLHDIIHDLTGKDSDNQPSLDQAIRDYLNQTKVQHIMSKDMVAIYEDEPFSHVPKKMEEYSIRHLPVVDRDRHLVGLITQRMMYKVKSPRKLMDGGWHYDEEMLNNIILKNVMQKDPFTLTPDRPLGEALMKVVYAKYGCIPIVDQMKRLQGIVTRNDILRVAANIYEAKQS